MPIHRSRRSCLPVGFSILIFAVLNFVQAQAGWAASPAYPTRPITMVVPFAAGGAIDLSSKIVAEKISVILGQPIISAY